MVVGGYLSLYRAAEGLSEARSWRLSAALMLPYRRPAISFHRVARSMHVRPRKNDHQGDAYLFLTGLGNVMACGQDDFEIGALSEKALNVSDRVRYLLSCHA